MAKIISSGLERIEHTQRREEIEYAMEEGVMEAVPRLERRTPYLATLANIATLLGLLNVIAALASFFVPGLGQLIQGRLIMAVVHFVLAAVLWVVLLGWVIHLWSILDAATFDPRR